MYITYEELFSLPDMARAKVLAGREYLTNMIQWYHLIEIEEMSKWINPGILIFITGVGLKDYEQGLINIIEILHRKNAAGLVINEGEYIPDIPYSVIAKANEVGLPLILLPREVRLLDVTYQLSRLFQEKQMKLKRRDQILYELLMSEGDGVLRFDNVEGFDARYVYAVCVLSCRAEDDRNVDMQNISNVINRFRTKSKRNIVAISLHNDYVFFVPFERGENGNVRTDVVNQLSGDIARELSGTVYGGVGRAASRPSELRESYVEAGRALYIARCGILGKKIIHFNELTLFRIIDTNNREELHNIVRECLGELVNHEELFRTFVVYLRNDRNMKRTAEELFIHVNSVKYRLQQVYGLLPVEPDNAFDWNRVFIAVYVYQYLRHIEESG